MLANWLILSELGAQVDRKHVIITPVLLDGLKHELRKS